eukprot:scaffold242195_cov24-Tisochrysis_lutea.AAC.1
MRESCHGAPAATSPPDEAHHVASGDIPTARSWPFVPNTMAHPQTVQLTIFATTCALEQGVRANSPRLRHHQPCMRVCAKYHGWDA